MRARCVGLFINDKQCESIHVPFPHGSGDFQSQTGPERPLRPSPLFHHPKVMPREVNRLTWSHTEVGPPWLGLQAGYRTALVFRFVPGPRVGGQPPQALPLVWELWSKGAAPALSCCSSFMLGCGRHSVLASPCMEAWAVCICTPLALLHQDSGTIHVAAPLPQPLQPLSLSRRVE